MRHKITVTMDERETEFIRERMKSKDLKASDRYGWKFIFDDGAVGQAVITGPDEKNAPDFPLVFTYVYGQTPDGLNWASDGSGPVGVFFGKHFFQHGNDTYEMSLEPYDNGKWEVHHKGVHKDEPA